MKKIIVTEFITLDGVVQDPHKWSFAYWGDDIAKFKNDETMRNAEALLLGRVTYEGFAAAWPGRAGDPFADRFNSMPKHVVTKTLKSLEWNNSRAIGIEDVAKLKEGSAGDIYIHGSPSLVNGLIGRDLIDEYHLLSYPLVLGSGLRLFKDGIEAKMKLAEAKPIGDKGVVLLRYEPAR